MEVRWEMIVIGAFWVVGIQQWLKYGADKLFPDNKISGVVWWIASAGLSILFGIVLTFAPQSAFFKVLANALSILSMAQVGYESLYKRIVGDKTLSGGKTEQ